MRISPWYNLAFASVGLAIKLYAPVWFDSRSPVLITTLLFLIVIFSLGMGISETFLKWRIVKKFVQKAERFVDEWGNFPEGYYESNPPLNHNEFFYFMKVFCDGLEISGAFKENLVFRIKNDIYSIYKSAFHQKEGNLGGYSGIKVALKKLSKYLKKDIYKDLNENTFQEDSFKPWKLKSFKNFIKRPREKEDPNLPEDIKLGKKLF